MIDPPIPGAIVPQRFGFLPNLPAAHRSVGSLPLIINVDEAQSAIAAETPGWHFQNETRILFRSLRGFYMATGGIFWPELILLQGELVSLSVKLYGD
jgi:hypothetical protein